MTAERASAEGTDSARATGAVRGAVTGAVTGAARPSMLESTVACTTATGDVAMRTALATLLTASFAPVALSRRSTRFEHAQLRFYAEVAAEADPTETFLDPPDAVPVRARRINPPPWLRAIGRIDRLSFESPFEPLNPALVDSYGAHTRNRIARAQHWRHLDGPRPTIVVLHGFMGSPYLFNSAFFSLPWFYGHGYDVLLVTMPFHGARAARSSPYSGHGFFANGIAHLNEAVLQAVTDVRVLVGYLLDRGAGRVGVTGLSLGGYTCAVLAAAEPRLHFAIPNAPVTEMAGLIRSWFPAGQLMNVALSRQGVEFDDLRAALAVHSPLTYPPALAHDRLFIIGGLGDRLAPPSQARLLWEHWGRCKLHWYPGNHVLHVNRGEYLKEMGRFLQAVGFAFDDAPAAA
jgi:pimeloyl-ACP methyl ester carboxylesterase